MSALRVNISGGSPYEPTVGYSRAVRVGAAVHVSGTTASSEGGALATGPRAALLQARETLAIIRRILEANGARVEDVVRTRMYVVDIATNAADVGAAHGEVFSSVRPAATMVGVAALIDPAMLVEIEGAHYSHSVLRSGVVVIPPHQGQLAASTVASALEAIVHAVIRNTANRRAELERLLILPTCSVASSPSRGATVLLRSQERFRLKVEVISFYGLWDPATADEPDVALRRVFTMLPERGGSGDGVARVSVALSDAVLAHIWPSVLASESDAMRCLLGLPPAFHLKVRNFLILDERAAGAFDADALLLLPVRAALPAPPCVRARPFRLAEVALSGTAARDAVEALAGRELFLPLAADGRVPFMRLLAWKALSALRAGAEEADENATTTFPDDATLTRERRGGCVHGAAMGGAMLLSTGLVFGFGASA